MDDWSSFVIQVKNQTKPNQTNPKKPLPQHFSQQSESKGPFITYIIKSALFLTLRLRLKSLPSL